MSKVRMCDKCGNIFSEREEGWSNLTQTRELRNEHNVPYTEQINMDVCPECAIPDVAKRPTLTIEGGK